MHESFNNHNVIEKAKNITQNAQSPIVCENCCTVLATLTNGWNFWLSGGIGVPGSPDIAAFSCDSSQHWACSIDCWEKVAHACATEHLKATMQQAHDNLEERRLAYEKEVNNGDTINKV